VFLPTLVKHFQVVEAELVAEVDQYGYLAAHILDVVDKMEQLVLLLLQRRFILVVIIHAKIILLHNDPKDAIVAVHHHFGFQFEIRGEERVDVVGPVENYGFGLHIVSLSQIPAHI